MADQSATEEGRWRPDLVDVAMLANHLKTTLAGGEQVAWESIARSALEWRGERVFVTTQENVRLRAFVTWLRLACEEKAAHIDIEAAIQRLRADLTHSGESEGR